MPKGIYPHRRGYHLAHPRKSPSKGPAKVAVNKKPTRIKAKSTLAVQSVVRGGLRVARYTPVKA